MASSRLGAGRVPQYPRASTAGRSPVKPRSSRGSITGCTVRTANGALPTGARDPSEARGRWSQRDPRVPPAIRRRNGRRARPSQAAGRRARERPVDAVRLAPARTPWPAHCAAIQRTRGAGPARRRAASPTTRNGPGVTDPTSIGRRDGSRRGPARHRVRRPNRRHGTPTAAPRHRCSRSSTRRSASTRPMAARRRRTRPTATSERTSKASAGSRSRWSSPSMRRRRCCPAASPASTCSSSSRASSSPGCSCASSSAGVSIDLPTFYARRVRRLLPAAVLALGATLLLSAWILPPLELPRVAGDGVASALSVANIRFALARGRLLRGGVVAIAVPPLLVAQRRGAVLPRLAGDAPARVPLRPRPKRPRRGHPRDRHRLARAPRSGITDSRRELGVLLPADARLAAGRGRAPRDRRAPPLPLTRRRDRARARRLDRVRRGRPRAACSSTTRSPIRAPGRSSRRSARPHSSRAAIALLSPGILLRTAPMRFLGRISYALYLWHWPLLVLPVVALGRRARRPSHALALVGIAVAVATLSTVLVEEPIRRGSGQATGRRQAIVVGGLGMALLLSVGVGVGDDRLRHRRGDRGIAARRRRRPDEEPPARRIPPRLDRARGCAHRDGRRSLDDGAVDAGARRRRGPTTPTRRREPSRRPSSGRARSDRRTVPAPTYRSVRGRGLTRARIGRGARREAVKPAERRPRADPAPTPRPQRQPQARREPPVIRLPGRRASRAVWDAPEDEELLRRNGCLHSEEVTVPRTCESGATRSRTIVALVGDSHASHWYPALREVANQQGLAARDVREGVVPVRGHAGAQPPAQARVPRVRTLQRQRGEPAEASASPISSSRR